jgi:hypothetical protein
MNKHIRLIPALAFSMAMLSMPPLATAQNATINVLSPATVVAKGAGVDVSVQISCSPPFLSSAQASAFVCLNQRVGNKIAFGCNNTSTDPTTCNGSPQTFEAIVIPGNGSGRYGVGPAIAQASGTVLDGVMYQFPSQSKQIQVVK